MLSRCLCRSFTTLIQSPHLRLTLRPLSQSLYRSFAVKAGSTRYTKAHEYVKLDSDSTGTVGISDFAQKELGDVVYVELPENGASFKQGEEFGAVESTKASSSVYAPVDLEVLEVNEEVKNDTGLVNQSPEKDAWFIKAKISDAAQLDKLMDEAAYKQFCDTEAKEH